MQHLDPDAQIAIKQRALEDMLKHIGRVQAAQILPPIYGAFWGYRMKARFSARFVAKKGGMLVGFRERNSRFVMDMEHCQVVTPHVSALLKPLRALLETLSVARRCLRLNWQWGMRRRSWSCATSNLCLPRITINCGSLPKSTKYSGGCSLKARKRRIL